MKKIFFFLFFLPIIVNAKTIKSVEVLNGTLSREFEPSNNVYSVVLNDDATSLMLNIETYEGVSVNILNNYYVDGGENKVVYETKNELGEKEDYVFYLEKNNTLSVFNNNYIEEEKQKVIPHLKAYVILGCLLINLILFKVIVLGFKK